MNVDESDRSRDNVAYWTENKLACEQNGSLCAQGHFPRVLSFPT
jgi:hypothetical protein